MKSSYYLTPSLLMLLLSGFVFAGSVCAQSDILDRFAGAYTVKNGPQHVEFVLAPQGETLHGNIVYGGRDYPLTATVDGLTLKGDFGADGNFFHFRMPLSTKSQFDVTFTDDDFGAWTFLRTRLPNFAGQFNTNFGQVTLTRTTRGQYTGQYVARASGKVIPLHGVSRGLEVELQGAGNGKVLYSFDDDVYFVQMDGQFSSASYKTPKVLEKERLVRLAQDDDAWRQALSTPTAFALDQYKQDWPKGSHVGEIPALKEQWLWRDALPSNRIEDYQDYIKRYPNGKYVNTADDAVWSIAQKRQTDAGYDDYINAFPSGRHNDQALASKEDLAWRKAIGRSRIKDYKLYAQKYPNGPHLKSADERAWAIAVHSGKDTAFDAYLNAFPEGIYSGDVADAKDFVIAKRVDNMASYKNYIAAHPDGRYAKKAQAGIQSKLSAIDAEKDDVAWQKAQTLNSQAAIEQYVAIWPNGRHIDKVRPAIKQIQKAQNERQDDSAFTTAQRTNSLLSYQSYLAKFGNGRHQQDALSAIENLQKTIDEQLAFVSSVQSKLQTLGFANLSLSGKLDNKTRTAIRKFERGLKRPIHGKASAELITQLDGAIAYNSNMAKAKKDSAEHMMAVGNALFVGSGVATDKTKAVAWYKKAAEEGNPDGMAKLGYSYVTGTGIKKNEKVGLKWLKKSIRFNNPEAMYQLALLYFQGIEVRQNNKKGIGWLVKSANNGRLQSFDFLGDLYNDGKYGIEKNAKEASKWYSKTASE